MAPGIIQFSTRLIPKCMGDDLYLIVSFQVVQEHVDADGKVSGVVGIRPVPALGAELPPLHHHRMEVDQREEDALELVLTGTYLQGFL